MESEEEKKQQDSSTEQSRATEQSPNKYEGYEPVQRNYQSGDRAQRPRIHTQRPYDGGRRYEGSNTEQFRPEGFGAALQNDNQSGQRPYRPRYNDNEGGGYQPRQQGGYHPRYNNNEGGNYQSRSQGGYQSRQQGGYQPHQQGGYQPRQQGGYQPRQQGGYNPNYNQGGNGYQPRQQGGYNPNYNQGGNGGYQPRQQGGYQQRGGYQNGGYNNNRGYNNRGYNQGGFNQRQGGYRQHSADYDPNAKYSLKKRIEYSEENIDPTVPIRLNKYLANAGVCSRREADEFIQSGAVTVNGEVKTELGTKVMRSDVVEFNGKTVSLEKKVYVLLNKPKDYVTTSDDPQQRKTVMDLVKGSCEERIYPVGRLDRNTTGVLLLTNDGDLASKLTHPQFLKKKVYHVFLDKAITEHDIQQIAEGVTLDDGDVHADAIEYASDTDKKQVGIEIHSGKNRIVRRIFESLGYRVRKLDRVQFAGLTKKGLRRGDWRYLTENEVVMLRMGAFE